MKKIICFVDSSHAQNRFYNTVDHDPRLCKKKLYFNQFDNAMLFTKCIFSL
jgi:hypothetical protein